MSEISARAPLPRFLQKGRGATLRQPLENSEGQPVAVTGGAFSLFDADGSVVVDAAAVTITAGVASYALPSTFADNHQLPQYPWREQWALTGISGYDESGFTAELECHVCRVAPRRHVTVTDLGKLQTTWPRLLAKTRPDYGAFIETAWEELIGRLLGMGVLPQRTLNWWAVAQAHKYWAASLVCRDFQGANPAENRWGELATEYWDRSQTELEDYLKLQADRDEDGVADDPGTLESAEPELFFTNVPAPSRWGQPW